MACVCSRREDLLAVGWLANREREKRHAARTYFNYNLRLEPTNVCQASCLFCSFARLRPGMPEAYTMSLEQAWDKLRQRANQPLTELHIVNGLNPDLPFSYYTGPAAGLQANPPTIHLKCFTAVEIAFFSELYGMSDEQVLRELRDAGPRFTPGWRRRDLCRARASKDLPRQVRRRPVPLDPSHRPWNGASHERDDALRAHRDDGGARRSHAARADAADERAGSRQFIPLAFHPDNNQMRKLPAPTGTDTLRVHAVSRLMLDNIPHIKAFWIRDRCRARADVIVVWRG
jgi:aminodeoxyfutalosine synthase